MAWVPLVMQALVHVPQLIDTGIKLADAIMSEPAVSDDDKAKLLAELETKRAALDSLVERVKASRFTVPPA